MEGAKKVTIREVAALAGVSISSVSRYLADPKSVQPLAAYNIKNAIAELKFAPNSFAQSLKRGSSRLIGVVVPHMEYFFGKACSVISDYFFERDYVTVICESDNSGDKERFYVQELLNQRVAGLVIIPCGLNTAFLESVAHTYEKMVILDRAENIGCDIVTANHEENAFTLARHFLKTYPCDEMLLLLGAAAASSVRDSVHGVERAFEDAGRDAGKLNKVYHCRNIDNLTAAVRELYERIKPGLRPAILALGEDFLEYAVMVLNQYGRESLSKIDLGGYAMPNALDKLGIASPCMIKDPNAAGIVTAEILYKKINSSDSKKTNEPPRMLELKVVRTFDE